MTEAVSLDRRQRRRQETIEEILAVAVDVMAEQGVAGLTLGEVARRMGIRPPSLYGYFDGKHALYDALFEHGYRLLVEHMNTLEAGADPQVSGAVFVRWAVAHPAYAPLMFWRPVPGFTPSEQAYTPALELQRMGREWLADLREREVLRADADLDLALRTWTVLTSGVVSQQLSNAPDEPFDSGTFTSTLPSLIDMWLTHFGAARSAHEGALS